MGKGALAAGVIASLRIDGLPADLPFWDIETVVRLSAGIAAVGGHMFPVWAHFRGGKGVNTSAGVLLALTPVNLLLALAVFFLVLVVFRYVSLASITATVSFPTILALRKYVLDNDALDASLLVFSIVMALGIIIAHRSNIYRLIQGKENRIHLSKTKQEGSQPVS
jgi:glycerol-3-phosphate acyltransferase PlsY